MAVTENGTSTVYVNSLWTDEEAFLNDATRPADAVWGVNVFAKFTDALNFAAKNAAVTKIEVGSDVTETDVVDLENVTHDLEIVASEGKTVTVTIPGATAGAGDSICIEEGATLTIGEGVKFNQFDQVVPGYTGTGSLVVNSDVSFNRIQSWGNSTVTINKTGSVNLTGDDGYLYFVGNQAFLNVYGNLTGTDNESLKTAKKSLHIGYANMRDYWNSGNTITFNFKDAYITCGRSFDSSANKLVFNADNSVFEMVGGDFPGVITLSNTVEFNLSNDARIITSTLTANAGSVVSFEGGSLEAQTFTNNGTFTVGGVSSLNIASGTGDIDLEGTLAAGSNAGGMTIRAQGTDAKIVGEADKATNLGVVKVNGSTEYSDTAVALEISGTNITTSTLYIGTTGGATTGNKLTITGDNNRETLDVKSGAFYVKAKNNFVLNDVNFSAGQYSINGTMTVTNSVLTCDDASFGVYSGGSLSITNSTLTTWTNKGNLNGGIFLGDGGNGWGYAPSVGTMEVLEGSSVKTTAVVLKSSQNALTVKNSSIEAVTKISVGEDAKVTLEGAATLETDAMDNAGTITMDASSDITAKAITGTGDLVIKLTADEIASGVTDKVIDVTDGSAFDSITVVDADGNAVAGFGAFRAEDGDVWVSNADMTTLYVDSAWSTEYKFGDAITGIEGAVYGMNAFTDYASAKAAVSNVTENMIIAGDINAGGVFDNLIEVGEDLAYWSGPSPVENTFAVEVNAAVKSGSTVLNNNTVTVGETGSIEAFDHHLTVFGEAGSLVVDGDADGSVRNTEKQLAVSQLRVAFGGSADIRDTTIEVRAITVGADAWDDTGYSSTLTLTNTTVEYQGFGDGSQLNINVKEGNTLSIADSELVKKNASSTIAVVNNGAFELSGTVLEAVSVANAGTITMDAGSSLSVNGTLTIGAYLNISGLTANTDYGFNIDGVKFDTTADANGNIRLFTTALTDGEKSVTLIDPTSWTSVSTTVTVTNGSLKVNVDSEVAFETLTAAKESIIVDTDGYTGGTKHILNNKGADLTKADYEAVVKGDAALDATVGAGKFIVANGDLYLTDAKQDILYVNSSYTEESAAEDGKILGYNAFNTMQAALDVLENGPATLNITGETADTTASVTLTEGGEYGITGGNGNHINEIFVRNGDKEITEANRISLTFEGADVVFSKFGEEKVDGKYFGNYDVEITDSIVSGKFYLGYGDQAFMTVRGNSTFKVNNSLFGFDAGASAAFKDLPVGAAATKEADILPLNGSGVQGVLGMAYGDDSGSEITDSTAAFRSFNVGCGADVTIDNSVVYLCGGMGIGASYYGAGAEGKVASVTVTGGSIVRDLAWGSHGGAYDPISIGEDTSILGTALLRVEDGSEFSYMSSVFNGKPAGYPAITVGSKGAVEVEDATFKASSVKIDNNGSFTVSSTEEGKSSTLNIGTLTGTISATGTIADSTIGGGTLFADGDLTFIGENNIGTLNFGWYNNTITIGKDASVTTSRSTLSFGNTLDVDGAIVDAKTANKEELTASLTMSGGFSLTNTATANGKNATLDVDNAYVVIGETSSKTASGTFVLDFNNSIVDFTKGFKFYSTQNGYDPSLVFTAKDSVVSLQQLVLETEEDDVVSFDNSNLTVSSKFRNTGKISFTNGSVFTMNADMYGTNGSTDGYGFTGELAADKSTLTLNKILRGSAGANELDVAAGSVVLTNGAVLNATKGIKNLTTLSSTNSTVNTTTVDGIGTLTVTNGTFTADSVTNNGSLTVDGGTFKVTGTLTHKGTEARFNNATLDIGTLLTQGAFALIEGTSLVQIDDLNYDIPASERYALRLAQGTTLLNGTTIQGKGRVRAIGDVSIGQNSTDVVSIESFDVRADEGCTLTVNGTLNITGSGREAYYTYPSGNGGIPVCIAFVGGTADDAHLLTGNGTISTTACTYFESCYVTVDEGLTFNISGDAAHLRFTGAVVDIKGTLASNSTVDVLNQMTSATVTVQGDGASLQTDGRFDIGYDTYNFNPSAKYASSLIVKDEASVKFAGLFVNQQSSISVENATFEVTGAIGRFEDGATFTVKGTSSISGDFSAVDISADGAVTLSSANGLTMADLIDGDVTYGAGNFTITGTVEAGTVDVSAGTVMDITAAVADGKLAFDDAAATITLGSLTYTGSLSRSGTVIAEGVDTLDSFLFDWDSSVDGAETITFTDGVATLNPGENSTIKFEFKDGVLTGYEETDEFNHGTETAETLTTLDGAYYYGGDKTESNENATGNTSHTTKVVLSDNDGNSRVIGGDLIVGDSYVTGSAASTEVKVNGDGGLGKGVFGGSRLDGENAQYSNKTDSTVTIETTGTAAEFSGTVAGSHVVANGQVNTAAGSKSTVNIDTEATFNGNIVGGMLAGTGDNSHNGTTNVNISGASTFEGNVYGGSVVQTEANITQYGDANVTISGGTFNDRIYGGHGASKSSVGKTTLYGDTNVTLSGGTFNGNIFAGSYGEGVVNGSTNVTLSGTADINKVLNGDSSSGKTSYVTGNRTLIFNGFEGDSEGNGNFDATAIRNFDVIEFSGDSDVVLENANALELEQDMSWYFEDGSSLSGFASLDLDDTAMSLGGVADGLADGSRWDIMSGDEITGLDGLDSVRVMLGEGDYVKLTYADGIWSGVNGSDNYKLSINEEDGKDKLTFVVEKI